MKYIKSTESAGIFVDLEGLEKTLIASGMSEEMITSWCTFRTTTYQALSSKSNNEKYPAWAALFAPANRFFTTLSDKELLYIVATLMEANQVITEFSNYLMDSKISGDRTDLKVRIQNVGDKLDDLVVKLDNTIDLYNRIFDFCIRNIKIFKLKNAGERAQDSPDMTFYSDEIDHFTAVSLLCKILSPIMGAYIECFNSSNFENKCTKEIYCAHMLDSIMEKHEATAALMEKLDYYIRRTLHADKRVGFNRKDDDNARFTQSFNGYTPSVAVLQTKSTLLTKRLVTVNLDDLPKGIGSYIYSNISNSKRYSSNSQKQNNTVRGMLDPSDSDYDDDQSNSSILEASSVVSHQTNDYKDVISFSAEIAKGRFCAHHDLDINLVNDFTNYYRIHQVRLQPINNYLLGLIFGSYICGAKSVEMLTPHYLNMLTAMAQLWLCQHNYYEIAILMSADRSSNLRTTSTGQLAVIKASWDRSSSFKNCDARLVYRNKSLKWSTSLGKIVDDIIAHNYRYNLPPGLVELIKHSISEDGEEVTVPDNGSVINIVDSIPRDICSITYEWI